jgi:ABC-2 type transport system ATP-binding protein
VDALLDQVSLLDKRKELVGSLSRGMRQRLFLAKTLLHDPDVLLLDEPASGLDPIARAELVDVLRGLGDAGKAVLVSSHILSEMDRFCNAVGIMEQGVMKLSGRIEEIVRSMHQLQILSIQLATPADGLGAFLEDQAEVHKVEAELARYRVEFSGDEAARAALLRALVEGGFEVSDFAVQETDLDEIFRSVAKGEGP